MATYCECGHVWAVHVEPLVDDEGVVIGPAWCMGDEGDVCDCEAFAEIPASELELGYD